MKLKSKHRQQTPETPKEPSPMIQDENTQRAPEQPEQITFKVDEEPIKEIVPLEEEAPVITEQELEERRMPVPEEPVIERVIQSPPPPPEPKSEPKFEVPAPKLEARVGQEELSEEEKYISEMRTKGTAEQKQILAAVETFETKLRPRSPITPEAANSAQLEFLGHLLAILDKEYEQFRPAWNLLLVYFEARHGHSSPASYTALSEYNSNRYVQNWKRNEERGVCYVNLFTLLRTTRHKETRMHDIKTISIDRIGPEVLSAQAVANLKTFYNV